MGCPHYLAMTAAEFRAADNLPEKSAWMGCHFSPYGTGLSNLPRQLPPGSLLLLDDITPIHGHDPLLIGAQLAACVEALGCCGVLLDFQREGYAESGGLAKHLAEALPCPVGVSQTYAGETEAAVLLPPVPCHVPLKAYLAPWEGRKIWLETALDGEVITVKEDGAVILPQEGFPETGFQEASLHCHYTIEAGEDAVTFTLWRSREDLAALLEEAEKLGVGLAVGLYQEFGNRSV